MFRPRTVYAGLLPEFEYNERFRLKNDKFVDLLNTLEPFLVHHTRRNKALTPQQQLQIALHWMGTGAQYHAVGDMHGVSKASVCRIIHKVARLVNELVLPHVVDWPDNVAHVIGQFYDIGGMPQVCGIVDGTLINIDAPHDHEDQFVDRHGNHSINVMLVAGPDLQFYYCTANWPGSTNDARVLRTSNLANRFEGGWRPFPESVLLGDSIYPLKSWLIPPIIRDPDNLQQRRFLRAHRTTRRLVENAIGILKEKFPCMNHLRLNPVRACRVIQACVALCNLSRDERDEPAIPLDDENLEDGIDLQEMEEVDLQDVEEVAVGGEEKLQRFYNHFL